MAISYEQARADHEYLWSIGPANDMTGAYVDQDDLQKLLRNPTKATARDCYISQIEYWFQAGPDCGSHEISKFKSANSWVDKDRRVREIYDRYH